MPRRGTSKNVVAPLPQCSTGPFGRSQTPEGGVCASLRLPLRGNSYRHARRGLRRDPGRPPRMSNSPFVFFRSRVHPEFNNSSPPLH